MLNKGPTALFIASSAFKSRTKLRADSSSFVSNKVWLGLPRAPQAARDERHEFFQPFWPEFDRALLLGAHVGRHQ
jgi:hypothetical protein